MVDARQKEIWLAEFTLHGFVVLRNFLPAELVATMHAELAPYLAAQYRTIKEGGFEKGRGEERIAVDVAKYAEARGGAIGSDEYLRNPVVEELVEAILGEGRWQRHWTICEACFKGSRHMTWHSDQKVEDTPDPDGPHVPCRVTYNIPLVDFMWANGAIEMVPGSHWLPRTLAMRLPFSEIPVVHSVPLYLRRGDALLRDGNTLHRGTPNLTDEPRPMLDQTYKLAM